MAKTEIKSTYWDKEWLIKEVQAGENNLIRFSICTKNRRQYLSIREWYKIKTHDHIYAPGRHGMAVALDDVAIITDLMSALEDTWAELTTKEEA